MNNNNITMSIYESIVAGLSIANKKEARVNENRVSVELFANWMALEKVAYNALYDYAEARERVKVAKSHGEDCTIDKAISDSAFSALRSLLNAIGEVNGHKLIANDDMLIDVCACVYTVKKPLVGEAFTQASIVANLRKEVNGFANGMNPEYVQAKTVEFEAAKVKLALLKKQVHSCDNKKERAKFDEFRLSIENELARVANKQEMTPRAELEARDAALKAERAAKRKANKQAKSAQK